MPMPPPAADPRCPSCGALTPPGESGRPAQWCTLCLEPLHVQAQAPDPAPAVTAPDAAPPVDIAPTSPPPASALPAPAAGTAPLAGPNDPVPGALDERMVDQMLVELRASQGADPWVARSQQVEGKAQRLVLGVLVGVGVTLVLVAVAWLVGLLLT